MLPEIAQCVSANRNDTRYCLRTNQLTLVFSAATLAQKYFKARPGDMTPTGWAGRIDQNLSRITHDLKERLNGIDAELERHEASIDDNLAEERIRRVAKAKESLLRRAFI